MVVGHLWYFNWHAFIIFEWSMLSTHKNMMSQRVSSFNCSIVSSTDLANDAFAILFKISAIIKCFHYKNSIYHNCHFVQIPCCGTVLFLRIERRNLFTMLTCVRALQGWCYSTSCIYLDFIWTWCTPQLQLVGCTDKLPSLNDCLKKLLSIHNLQACLLRQYSVIERRRHHPVLPFARVVLQGCWCSTSISETLPTYS